jgi:hypothetical protein
MFALSEKLPGMPQTIFQTIISYLKDSLEKQKDQAREELKKLEDRKRPARTCNPDFEKRSAKKAMALAVQAKDSEDHQTNGAWETPMAFPRPDPARKLAGDALIYYDVRRHPMKSLFDHINSLTTFVTDRSHCLCRQRYDPSYRALSPCAP